MRRASSPLVRVVHLFTARTRSAPPRRTLARRTSSPCCASRESARRIELGAELRRGAPRLGARLHPASEPLALAARLLAARARGAPPQRAAPGVRSRAASSSAPSRTPSEPAVVSSAPSRVERAAVARPDLACASILPASRSRSLRVSSPLVRVTRLSPRCASRESACRVELGAKPHALRARRCELGAEPRRARPRLGARLHLVSERLALAARLLAARARSVPLHRAAPGERARDAPSSALSSTPSELDVASSAPSHVERGRGAPGLGARLHPSSETLARAARLLAVRVRGTPPCRLHAQRASSPLARAARLLAAAPRGRRARHVVRWSRARARAQPPRAPRAWPRAHVPR